MSEPRKKKRRHLIGRAPRLHVRFVVDVVVVVAHDLTLIAVTIERERVKIVRFLYKN